jgi:hypothetical protein
MTTIEKEHTMSQAALAQVMDRYTNDPTFRTELKTDPQGAIERSGIQLDPKEREAVENIDWSLPDEQLKERVSKIRA